MASTPVEIKPPFFSISGFFVPGLVLVGSIGMLLVVPSAPGRNAVIRQEALQQMKELGLLPTAIFLAALASAVFVTGSVLSDAFSMLRKKWLRPAMKSRRIAFLNEMFSKASLSELIRSNATPLEAYVYIQTCGLDLHWYAGRVRMLGGSAIALGLAAFLACFLSFPCWVGAVFMFAAVATFSVSWFRSHQFDKYVIATAAVLLEHGGDKQSASETTQTLKT
jgi:hypothetical protein